MRKLEEELEITEKEVYFVFFRNLDSLLLWSKMNKIKNFKNFIWIFLIFLGKNTFQHIPHSFNFKIFSFNTNLIYADS